MNLTNNPTESLELLEVAFGQATDYELKVTDVSAAMKNQVRAGYEHFCKKRGINLDPMNFKQLSHSECQEAQANKKKKIV